jgi:prepilin signal peptidase PulO-like enzyme (type II secretory pathway)
VIDVWQCVYDAIALLIVSGFAACDIKTKRVPDKALVFVLPVALAAPVIRMFAGSSGVLPPLLISVLGAAAGFGVLLAAALASKGGSGVGGGDIKLTAVLGLIYGPAEIIAVLLIASLLALPVGLIRRERSGGQTLRLPFVPFIAAGCLGITAFRLLAG